MKKMFILFVFILPIAFLSCNKDGDEKDNYMVKSEEKATITDFSLDESACQWKNLEQDSFLIINSYEELAPYISCGKSNPVIDFSRYTLLIVPSIANVGYISKIVKNLTQIPDNDGTPRIILDIGILLSTGPHPAYARANISFLLPKLPQDSKFSLFINSYESVSNN